MSDVQDNLFTTNPRRKCGAGCAGGWWLCKACADGGRGRRRRCRECEQCHECRGTGSDQSGLRGVWAGCAGFLVCGGPSLQRQPEAREALAERGICSVGVNNVAGYVRCTAWCFSDPQTKFHHGLFLDPKVITFSPSPKLTKSVRAKLPDGTFRYLSHDDGRRLTVADTPNSWGYARRTVLEPEDFLTSWYAQWGLGGKAGPDRPINRIATMLLGLRLCHFLGMERCYLLGVDLYKQSKEVGDAYCFNERGSGGNRMLSKENMMLGWLRPVFDKQGWTVLNANPESHCDAFARVPLRDAIDDCRSCVPREPFDLGGWYTKKPIAEAREQGNPTITLSELRVAQGVCGCECKQ